MTQTIQDRTILIDDIVLLREISTWFKMVTVLHCQLYSQVAKVTASDRDDGLNGQVLFALLPDSSHVQLNPPTFYINEFCEFVTCTLT
jgi:hypothetical protein